MRSSLSLLSTLSKLALLLTSLPEIYAISFTSVPSPNLDLSQLGRVALAGDFDSISLYDYVGQNENSLNTNGSEALLAQFPNGAFDALLSADGSIQSMCPFLMANGTLIGVVVGGNFTSFGGQNAQAIALYNPSTGVATPLPGLTGQVSTVFCDNTDQTVYVGGSFSGGNSTNAIAWTTGWTNLPFQGFNGPVTSIAKLANGNIVFGGSFTGIGNNTSSTAMNKQVVNVGSATITSSTSSLDSAYSSPRNIVCQTNNGSATGTNWISANNAPAYWEAQFGFGFEPSMLRLYNTKVEGYGTKTWRFTALPLNGLLNFTYTDVDGNLASCSSTCPLELNSTYQDFYFVNRIGMDAFRIDVSQWYGSGAGFGGIELFQDDIYSFAVQNFNEPVCDGVSNGSTSTAVGSWTTSVSVQTNAQYLTTSLPQGTTGSADVSVVFMPDITESGNYSIILYTPGCIADRTCSTRGHVNITGTVASATTSAAVPFSTQLWQTNNYDKYDQVFLGYVDATSPTFRPSVTLAPSSGQAGPLTVVAQRVRFQLLSSAQGLNGLYEFNPNQATINTDFSASAVDYAGVSLNAGATVSALTVHNNITYVAGSFSSADFSNIFAIQNGNATSLASGGLNAPVTAMYQNGSYLYVGGNFTNTRVGNTPGLGNVAAYSITNSSWQSLGAGVNGMVTDIVPITLNITANVPQQVLAISGFFSQVFAYGSNASFSVSNLAVWVPSAQNWLENLNTQSIALSGRIVSSTTIPNSTTLYAGAVSSQMLGANGVVALSTSGGLNLQQLPIQILPEQSTNQTTTRKRAAAVQQQVNGIVAGLFYNSNGLNLTIVGGHFSAKASNGSTIENLALINGSSSNSVTGLTSNMGADAAILALGTQGTTLFAGGSIPGALLSYDLVAGTSSPTQPPALTGNLATVNAIAVQPSGSRIAVGGSFTSAGSFACPALCIYDASSRQWSSPGTGVSQSSTVSALSWATATRLIVAGNLTLNGSYITMASYDATTSSLTPFTNAGSASALPGPITAFTPATPAYTTFFAAGVAASDNTAFLSQYNGSAWSPVGGALGPGTLILGLQVLALTQAHAAASSSLLSNTQTLLITGRLELPGFGNASAALWNGTAFTPFILSSMADGSPGLLRTAFVGNPQNFLMTSSHHLALGFIVLIALAIALIILFLLVVIGVLAERLRRRREGYIPAPTSMSSRPASPYKEKEKLVMIGIPSATQPTAAYGTGGGDMEEVRPGGMLQGPAQMVDVPPRLKFDFM